LPVGQIKGDNGRISSYSIDMLGFENGTHILCELKYANIATEYKAEECSSLDALLQLLSYYAMLVQNAAALDANNVHHLNARNREFKWQEVSKNVKLLIKAPQVYWNYWQGDYPLIHAFQSIMTKCNASGLIIETE
jgi:hypothetical protein